MTKVCQSSGLSKSWGGGSFILHLPQSAPVLQYQPGLCILDAQQLAIAIMRRKTANCHRKLLYWTFISNSVIKLSNPSKASAIAKISRFCSAQEYSNILARGLALYNR
jgi:hypothetical protein